MKSGKKLLCFGLLTGFSFVWMGKSHATPVLSDSEELALVKSTLLPLRQTSDAVWVTDNTALTDGTKIGSASETLNAQSYWYLDSGNNLYANSSTGGSWRTFMLAGVTGPWNATTSLVLNETTRDGAAPGNPYTLTLTLTKAATGSPANLTASNLVSGLRGSNTRTFSTLTGTGTAITAASSASFTTGWTITALGKDGTNAATSITLDPEEDSFTIPLTPSGGTASTYITTRKQLHSMNVATNDATDFSQAFISNPFDGSAFTMTFRPGSMARTSGIAAQILGAMTNLSGRRIYVSETETSLYPPVNNVVSSLARLLVATNDAPLSSKMQNMAITTGVSSASFVVDDFTTTDDTDNLGLLVLGDTDLTAITWKTDDTKVIANGKYGANSFAEDYICDLSTLGAAKIDSATNPVLTFKSNSGRHLVMKCFADAPYLDESATTGVSATGKFTILALKLAGKLSVASVSAKTVDSAHH